jgi:hypothetical protein
MANNDGVIFRRVRGRIIPIKTQKKIKETAKAAAMIGAGLGVAAIGAATSGRMLAKSLAEAKKSISRTAIGKFAFGEGGHTSVVGGRVAKAMVSSAARSARAVKKLNKYSKYALSTGRFGGSILVGAGAFKLAKEYSGSFGLDQPGEQAFVSYLTGFTAGEFVNRAFLKGFDKNLAMRVFRRGR